MDVKLKLDKDTGEVRIPLIGRAVPEGQAPDESGQWLTLPEPNLDQLATLQEWVFEANATVPSMPVVPRGATPEQLAETVAKGEERLRTIRGGNGAFAGVVIRLVEMLTGETVERSNLPAWVCNPRTIDLMVEHWVDPLGGEDARMQAATEVVLQMLDRVAASV